MSDSKELPEQNNGEKVDLVQDEANQATTSKLSVDPEQNSHNMNDLKTLDFNSADEIRQTMKAVLSGKAPHAAEEDSSQRVKSNIDVKIATDNKPLEIDNVTDKEQLIKTVNTAPKENVFQFVNTKTDTLSSKKINLRNRPPKVGKSRKRRKATVTALYVGKLSNVVPFKRRRIYRSESETEDSL
ncbi:hypothetical protein evm_005919 [Chilo suppressalis]|nr:hypothetical protein evm_005919 [Chilo suppressalis]